MLFKRGNPPPKHREECHCFRCTGIPPNKGRILSESHKKHVSDTKRNQKKYKNLVGMIFGRWTVISLEGRDKRTLLWKCKCNCGNIRTIRSSSLIKGTSKSCGCLNKEILSSHTREHNGNWQGGKSFEPYGLQFNNALREQIRKRDGYRCQECFRHQNELFKKVKNGKISNYKLHIHHIDYNKKNCNPNNLISLCMQCHRQTSYNRKDWINYYQNKIKEVPYGRENLLEIPK